MIVRETLVECNGENYIQIRNCQVVTWTCCKIHTRLCDKVRYNAKSDVQVCILLLINIIVLPLSLIYLVTMLNWMYV